MGKRVECEVSFCGILSSPGINQVKFGAQPFRALHDLVGWNGNFEFLSCKGSSGKLRSPASMIVAESGIFSLSSCVESSSQNEGLSLVEAYTLIT